MAIAICATDSYAQSHYATKQAQESYDNGIKLERRSEEKGDMSFLRRRKRIPTSDQRRTQYGSSLYPIGIRPLRTQS